MSSDLHNKLALSMITNLCNVCAKPTPSQCSRCRDTFYCSVEHYELDWPTHRFYCTSSSRSTPPNHSAYNAILLAYDEITPRMVKLPYGWQTLSADSTERIQTLEHPAWPRCTSPLWIKRPAGGHLVAFINDSFTSDGSEKNECIRSVTEGTAPHSWVDHVFVLRKKGVDDPEYQDAVLEEDLPVLIKYLKEYE